MGGLGVHDLAAKNSVLLGKWLFKLLMKDRVWQTLLKRKYIGEKAISKFIGIGGLALLGWPNGNEEIFFKYGTFSIKVGSQIRFWEDIWLGNRPLSEQYPKFYSIVRRKSDTIALVMATSPPSVTFRRGLYG
jgi:hypothetical protein